MTRRHADTQPRQHSDTPSPMPLLPRLWMTARRSTIATPAPWIALALFLAFLALYTRTAAPDVLSGDSAEFQFAAPLLGVPHPTTYPLYTLLGKAATLLIPAGSMARRVTLLSSGCAALTVVLFFLLLRDVTRSPSAALLAALALGVAPGLWNAATIAEVYALLAALLAALGYLLVKDLATQNSRRPADSPLPGAARRRAWWLRLAAFVAGLGVTHHGLFILTGMPVLVGYVLWRLSLGRRHASQPSGAGRTLRQVLILAICFAIGMIPWLYPLIQFARFGPVDGADWGLPDRYFWGVPASWGAVFDLMTGGNLRRDIFRMPSVEAALHGGVLAGERLRFEFGPIGVLLGVFGFAVALLRMRGVWAATAWIFLATLGYLVLLGPSVQDAPVFTLPMLLPWAAWMGIGAAALMRRTANISLPSAIRRQWPLALLLLATLAWGYTRIPYSSKRRLWLFHEFGRATLQHLPANAVVITHWEQGTTLRYLIFIEGLRPDVQVSIVEPEDADWGAYARRYPQRPIFFVGHPADVTGLPVEVVRSDPYADLFRLNPP